jgi:hypothetical protein
MLGIHNGAQFVKSSHSDPDNCVYVARPAAGPVGVKDGKEGPDGTTLLFERDSWSAFLEFAQTFEV